jgi:hypothetical protein
MDKVALLVLHISRSFGRLKFTQMLISTTPEPLSSIFRPFPFQDLFHFPGVTLLNVTLGTGLTQE